MDWACVFTLPSPLVFSLLFPYISKHFLVLLLSLLIWHIAVYTDLNKWIRGTKAHTEQGMTWNAFIARWKGHCYCPTSPPSSRGVSAVRGDYRRRKNPLNTFCFVFLSFLSLLFAQRRTYEKEELYANGIAVYLLHSGIDTPWLQRPLECFEVKLEERHLFSSSCNNCSVHWYLTPRRMTGSDSASMTVGLGHKILVSNDVIPYRSNFKKQTPLALFNVQLQTMI